MVDTASSVKLAADESSFFPDLLLFDVILSKKLWLSYTSGLDLFDRVSSRGENIWKSKKEWEHKFPTSTPYGCQSEVHLKFFN